ncbi:ribosomal RNA-processing protein 8-like [Ctenocephalides felis]|uniref:ribosomal RNA-processing protein 8-like n=1 Tax=Ctenocephalides felis TaxID=7515 RepID=UPI000E6E3D45|nr:ribosomal RNA-processing protein 8-like [Ctenocephalides felis]
MKKTKPNSLFSPAKWDNDVIQESGLSTEPSVKCKLLERIKSKYTPANANTSKDKTPKTRLDMAEDSFIINTNNLSSSKRRRRQMKKLKRLENTKTGVKSNDKVKDQKDERTLRKLKKILHQTDSPAKEDQQMSFREKLWEKLKGSRFRYLNEQMYTSKGNDTQKMFQKDPSAFEAYHEGFRHQVLKWPLNPLDKIINEVNQMPSSYVIADFGCGEAKLASSVPQTVKSFDLVALNENVIACDMANVPLKSSSVDVVVFCLSLMGVNIKDYLLEASRVLKIGGTVKIAEVSSRFTDVNNFIKLVTKYGYKLLSKNLSHDMFYFMDFKKVSVPNKSKVPIIELKSCMYKKR